MKNILLIIFFSNLLYSQFPENFYLRDFTNGYYPIENDETKILSVGIDSLFFYGGNGVIIKTFDGGNTWEQNFIGTYGYILKMIKSGNNIFGISNFNEFMKSSDFGEFWEFNKFTTLLSSFDTLENNIYISTFPNDTILVTTDYGNSFLPIKTNIDSIIEIFSFKDKLIIQDTKNDLYYSSSGYKFQKLDLPNIADFVISKKENNIYLNNKNTIAKLNEDLTWDLDKILDIDKQFGFFPIENGFLIFKNQFDENNTKISDKKTIIYEYIRNNNTFRINIIDSLHPLIYNGFSTFFNFGNSLEIHDFIINNNNIYFSLFFNKIIKYENMQRFKIINEKYPRSSATTEIIFNDDYWIRISPNSSYLLKSTDGGISFLPLNSIISKYVLDNNINDTIIDFMMPTRYNNYFKDKDTFIFPLGNRFRLNQYSISSGFGSATSWAISKDGGLTYDIIQDSIRKHLFIDLPSNRSSIVFQSHIGSNFLISQNHGDINYFYLLDENYSMKLTSQIDSSSFAYCFYDNVNDLTWCKSVYYFDYITNNDTIRKENNTFYFTNDGYLWTQVFQITLDRYSDAEIGISKDNNIYILANKEKPFLYKYDLKTNEIEEVEFETKYNKLHFINDHYKNKLLRLEEDKIYATWIEEIDSMNLSRTAIVSLELRNDNYKVNTIFERIQPNTHIINPFYDDADFVYSKNIPSLWAHLYKKIEEDKYKYYTSINQKDINKELLEVYSFPNPAPKGQSISIELDEFAENITIYDLLGNEIMKINQFSNKYEIPTANLSSGIYITVIDLGGKRKISKFVVE